ncbi:hypothetical protein [Streptomyces chattanoogensis]|uniref:hypothetical protein n=1 Tax=Streptomyces chattanoogensis TaxID=66876 RepID=UPI00367EE7E5
MTISPQLIGRYEIPGARGFGSGSGEAWLNRTGPIPQLLINGPDALFVHELGQDVHLRATFPRPLPEKKARGIGVAPDCSFAVFTTDTAYIAVAPDGTHLWQHPHIDWGRCRHGYVDFSLHGPDHTIRTWLRLPSEAPDRTLFHTLDEAGHMVTRHELPIAGNVQQVSLQWRPDGDLGSVHVSGRASYRATLASGRIFLGERVDVKYVHAVAPSRRGIMTEDGHTPELRWHSFPSYEETVTLRIDDFPSPGTGDCTVHFKPWLMFAGGYLDEDTALVQLSDAYDTARCYGNDAWREYSHWLVDLATGTVRGRIAYPEWEEDSACPLGDGTWLTRERNDTLCRWTARGTASDAPAAGGDGGAGTGVRAAPRSSPRGKGRRHRR